LINSYRSNRRYKYWYLS